ncbi:hypothetical protein B0T17DRAFT_485082 [Bombardia bombarda]|uniref:F-box domain-containing protein n=1 Tax=Bombardia bombarda TaxID=252184 RepID=A0AA40CF67_9PEZI|nr:hypothetical protein B0T17DRAFT_485082 [Bombardia bombarda]
MLSQLDSYAGPSQLATPVFTKAQLVDVPSQPVDTQDDCYLARIPLEILLRITQSVPTTDLGNLRLSCKVFERALFSFFSHEFFRKKQFMVFPTSLQALIDISKHKKLSLCLRHVIIATDRYLDHDSSGYLGGRRNWEQEQERQKRIACAGHESLMSTGLLRDMLVEAFSNLPNLETVDIRDFNAGSRNRDGLGTCWTSYGATSLVRLTGEFMNHNRVMNHNRATSDPYPSQLFSAIIASLATANARPPNIEVVLRDRGWGLFENAFYIPPRIESSVLPVLASLTKLHIVFAQEGASPNTSPFLLKRFLSLTPNLTWFRLNVHGNGSSIWKRQTELLLTWLGLGETDPPLIDNDITPIRLQFLEQLDLGLVEMEPPVLLKLVLKFSSSLRRLSLRSVSMVDKKNDPKLNVNIWARIFQTLSKKAGLNLQSLDLANLQFVTQDDVVSVPLRIGGPVEFIDGQTKESRRSQTYTSQFSMMLLERAAAETTPMWPVCT